MYLAMAVLTISTFGKRKSARRKGGGGHSCSIWIPFHSVFYRFATRSVAEEKVYLYFGR